MSEDQFVPCVLGRNLARLHINVRGQIAHIDSKVAYTSPDHPSATALLGARQAYEWTLALIERMGEEAAAEGEKA